MPVNFQIITKVIITMQVGLYLALCWVVCISLNQGILPQEPGEQEQYMDPHYLNGAQDGSGRGRGGHPGRGRGGPPNASGPRLARVKFFSFWSWCVSRILLGFCVFIFVAVRVVKSNFKKMHLQLYY